MNFAKDVVSGRLWSVQVLPFNALVFELRSHHAEGQMIRTNCKSERPREQESPVDVLRRDLAALECERLIESFLDTEHVARYRVVSISKTTLVGSLLERRCGI